MNNAFDIFQSCLQFGLAQLRANTKGEDNMQNQAKTHLTSKDVDGIQNGEELQALMEESGIRQLCPNAKRILANKGIEITDTATA